MTENGVTWRPSMFLPQVVHLTHDGSIAYTSDRYPGARMLHAACGQDTNAEAGETVDSLRCPECATWLRSCDA